MNRPLFNPCVLIPVFNHENAVGNVVEKVLGHGIACILVDDGSSSSCAKILDELVDKKPDQLRLIRHEKNQGKGAASLTGMKYAASKGFTHALQIDADGQHTVEDIPFFLGTAAENPGAVITGYPLYDMSVPLPRLYCRYITHAWVWINTLSMAIRDSMCGFRVYPLDAVLRLIEHHSIRKRMAFDTDIIVRLYWEGADVVNLPTRVHYPFDGVSHFRAWLDNFQISCMHATLFFGMLLRIPRLLKRRCKRL